MNNFIVWGFLFMIFVWPVMMFMQEDKWECSARDVRNDECVEYSLKKFPETVTYEGEK